MMTTIQRGTLTPLAGLSSGISGEFKAFIADDWPRWLHGARISYIASRSLVVAGIEEKDGLILDRDLIH
jgi:hypothetical protein